MNEEGEEVDSLCHERQGDEDEDETDASSPPPSRRRHRPMYACRHPPLVQPLCISSFTERQRALYGTSDLAHEWVALFQTICGGGQKKTRAGGSSSGAMKMNIPDTIFLSPTGQPSVWYRTTASKHIKARHLSHVTPRAIHEAFTARRGKQDLSAVGCAVVRKGFQVTTLQAAQFTELCDQMGKACIRTRPRQRHSRSSSSEGEDDQDYHKDADADSGESPLDGDVFSVATNEDTILEPELNAFCIQQSMERVQNVSFLCVWKQLAVDTQPSPRVRERSPVKTTITTTGSMDELFLLDHQPQHTIDNASPAEDAQSMKLQRLCLEQANEARTAKTLHSLGFDTDATVPLLFHMKLLTAEIVSRINRSCASSRQVVSVACEYFISSRCGTSSAKTKEVFFAGLAGIQWQDREPTWQSLRRQDSLSRAIYEYCQAAEASAVTSSDGPASKLYPHAGQPKSPTIPTTPRRVNAALDLSCASFDELNPRFPSLQSPLVVEKQWKHKSVLLSPSVSPRYLGSEMPKMYRDGQFTPLLTPRQAHAVHGLYIPLTNATPPHYVPRHVLSKKHGDVERELWARQDADERAARGLLGLASSPPRSPQSPRSPRQAIEQSQSQSPDPDAPFSSRHRYKSILKEELL